MTSIHHHPSTTQLIHLLNCFLALALKVVTLTTVLVLGILLPMNLTAPCVEAKKILDCESRVNITTYEMTTLRNIPRLSVKDMSTSIWDLLIDLFYSLKQLQSIHWTTLYCGHCQRDYYIVYDAIFVERVGGCACA